MLIEMDYQNGAVSALMDFRFARYRADFEEFKARLRGKSAKLLSFDEVCQKLKAGSTVSRGLQDIPLDAIIGSVGRYPDFTRQFWPRQDQDADRWARVKAVMTSPCGVPPIEVYQIGQAYFVLDGNHRVSVARELGATRIDAYVTKVFTRVPLSPEIQPDELTVKAECVHFLERTDLDKQRPGADLSLTAAGQYALLERQIETHRCLKELKQRREISYTEAAGCWYDEVYLPVVEIIRAQSLLPDFPGRTETDLYVWISTYWAERVQRLNDPIPVRRAVADFAARFSPNLRRVLTRMGEKLAAKLIPDPLEAGSPAGQWRRELRFTHQDGPLFGDIFVLLNGEKEGWSALEQALRVARREDGRLHGLHVVPAAAQEAHHSAQGVQLEFDRRCREAGVGGGLVSKTGEAGQQIEERAYWADLVVISAAHPPGPGPLARLNSDLANLLRRCDRPVLAIPAAVSEMHRALLAYDGSPKADEALVVAAYLAASERWNLSLTVVTVADDRRVGPETLAQVQRYLQTQGIQATYQLESGPVAEAVLRAAVTHESDLIIMGGYGFNPALEIALGSTVDEVLRTGGWPVLICR
jgi:nucleotide-binding universal stress UspA family protein